MQIVFFCPPAGSINGGIKYIFRMAETLREFGYDAVVLEEKGLRPTWFPNTAPVFGQELLNPNPNQIYVLPEDQTHMLAPLKDWPQQKIIYSQNHFYSAYRLEDMKTYGDFGVKHVICSSRTIYDYARIRHPDVTAHIVPYSINAELFRPAAKQNRVAFMPRKRPIEATYIRDLFRFLHREYKDWQWQELHNIPEEQIAAGMSGARVFLSLSKLEGFGLTPLEAMAAGCVVAGFTGIGGREYATDENGFWTGEDDFEKLIPQIDEAIRLSLDTGPRRQAYDAACQKTLAAYTPGVFRQAVKDVWARILA